MSKPPPRLSRVDYRSVSERLSDRCDVLEGAVRQLLHNDQVSQAKITGLESTGMATATVCQERWESASETHKRLGDRVAHFSSMTRWQRLRWVFDL